MKEKNAYFTVEAAMVLPLALGVILFAVYLLLFQYNRCLSEQDAGVLAMWGSTLSGDAAVMEEQLQERLSEWYEEKYVAWEIEKFQVEMKSYQCLTEIAGQLAFPVPGWNFWNEENVWQQEADYEYVRLQPVDFVRMCRKWWK